MNYRNLQIKKRLGLLLYTMLLNVLILTINNISKIALM